MKSSPDPRQDRDEEGFDGEISTRGPFFEVGHDNGDDRRLWLLGAEGETELAKAGVEALGILPQVSALARAVH